MSNAAPAKSRTPSNHRRLNAALEKFAHLATAWTGSTWAFIEFGTSWISDPRISISFITWGIYLAMICLRVTAGWRGRKAACPSASATSAWSA